MKIYKASTIITLDEAGVIYDGALCVDDGMIIGVGEFNEMKIKYTEASVIDVGDGVLTPGLINVHHHLYSTFARGWDPDCSPRNFPEILELIWWRLDRDLTEEDIYYSALSGLLDSVKCGVTTVIDHHSSQRVIDGSLDLISQAFDEVGLRGSVCFEVSDREGEEALRRGVAENIRMINKLSKDHNSLVVPMFGFHASFTLSDDSLERVSQETQGLDCGYHFHLLEDSSDRVLSFSKYGAMPVERFEKYNLLNEKTIAAHGIHLLGGEISLLKDYGVFLAHCARSNMNNAVGVIDLSDFFDMGLSVGIGTDGMDGDVLSEASTALFIAKHNSEDANVGFEAVTESLLHLGYGFYNKISGLRIGKIAPDYKADFVLWDYNPPTEITNDNYKAHYLFGLAHTVAKSVWVDGKPIIDNMKFVSIDSGAIKSHSRKLSRELWRRL